MSQPLSPQAQAVLDAIQDVLDATAEVTPRTGSVAAAALRAVADQVERKWQGFARKACQEIRAIAAELEDKQ